jgi:citrate synthase
MSEPIYSPGLESVVAGETAISTLEGGLSYRGYSIEDLSSKATFEETAYLILHGDLPNAAELAAFRKRLGEYAPISPEVVSVLRTIPPSAPLMDVMRTGASLLAHFDPDIADSGRAANLRKAERLLAQLPVVMAARCRLKAGEAPIPPDPGRSLAANLLWMLRGTEPSAKHVRAMDVSLILYAEHEFNASTFTARVVTSTLSDLHSAITAAIGALKGPLHGGANERVMEVLEEVGSVERAEAWVRDALARKVKIMGFGHRVYKTGDPRATLLKTLCADLASESGSDRLEQIAETLERVVREEKKLPPNLDWPSARLYHYLGLAVELYTPLFVLSRVTGWSAHVIEQLENNRIIRPRSKYVGPTAKPWKSVGERS